MRVTAPRAQLYELLRRSGRHLGMTELLERLPQVGRATLYRNLELFERLGLVRRVGPERYAACAPGHRHLLACSACGLVVEFEACAAQEVAHSVAAESGFVITGHTFELTGLCPRCQKDPS
nr:Fur family transcriptional regulator [Deinobacterium chartae]